VRQLRFMQLFGQTPSQPSSPQSGPRVLWDTTILEVDGFLEDSRKSFAKEGNAAHRLFGHLVHKRCYCGLLQINLEYLG